MNRSRKSKRRSKSKRKTKRRSKRKSKRKSNRKFRASGGVAESVSAPYDDLLDNLVGETNNLLEDSARIVLVNGQSSGIERSQYLLSSSLINRPSFVHSVRYNPPPLLKNGQSSHLSIINCLFISILRLS